MEECLAWRSGVQFLPFPGGAGREQSLGEVPQIQCIYFVCDQPLLRIVVLSIAAVTVTFLIAVFQ